MDKGGRRGVGWLSSLLLAELLGGAGCLRFAYNDVDRLVSDAGRDGGQARPNDAGDVQDAQPTAAGRGAGAGAGAGGRVASLAGSGGRASGGGGGVGQVSDAGMPDAARADAAVSDAGASDAASGDAGVDAGPAGTGNCLDGAGVLDCNGFEVYPFEDQWGYNVIVNADTAQSTTIKHSGAGALRASTRSAKINSSARYATRKLNGQRSGEIWSRYYYYVPTSTVITWWISSGVISEISEPYEGFDLLIHANYVEIESMLGYFDQGVPFPRDRWVCVELHAVVHSSHGYFEAFLDGTQVAISAQGDTVPAGGFTSAEYGIHYAEARQGPVEVYVDDVAVGTQRIPCD